jgi:hypothetical protein
MFQKQGYEMNEEELKLLRLQNQYLLSPAPSEEVVRGLIGLQAQYGAAALLTLKLRANDEPAFSQLVKTWSFRGTLHLHDKRDLPLVLYKGSETDFGQMSFLDETIAQGRCELFRGAIRRALSEGDKTRESLKAECVREGMTGREAEIFLHPWGGLFRAMAEKGEIAYTPDGNRVFTLLEQMNQMEEGEALAELVRRYLLHYAPVSLRDAQSFFGLPQRKLKHLLESTAQNETTFGGNTYFMMKQSLLQDAQMPAVVFLASFDQLLLGYRKAENPFLKESTIKAIYNNTGIIFATVLLDGIASAVWKRTGNQFEIRPLVPIGVRDRKKIERKAVDNFGKVAVQWTGVQA